MGVGLPALATHFWGEEKTGSAHDTRRWCIENTPTTPSPCRRITSNTWEFWVQLDFNFVCLFFAGSRADVFVFPATGPIIRAEVGEQIVITFKNKASRPYSITAHGVKASGAHIPNRPGETMEAAGRLF